MRHTVCCVLLASAVAVASAYQPSLDLRAVSEAISVGQSRVEADRRRFHQPYRMIVNRPPVDAIEIITPFRHVVLAAERARAGAGFFTQREGLAALDAFGPRLEVLVEMTFHPLNTYVAVPAFRVTLQPAAASRTAIEAVDIDRTPRTGALVQGSQPILGATVTARFSAAALDASGAYDVVIREMEVEAGRTRVNLGSFR